MDKNISIKFNKQSVTKVYIEKSLDGLKEIVNQSSYKNIILLCQDDKNQYVSIIKNIITDKSVEVSHINELKEETDSLVLIIGNENFIESCGSQIENLSFAVIPTSIKSMADYSIYNELPVKSTSSLAFIYINIDFVVSMSDKAFYNNFSYIMRLGLVKNLKFYIWLIDNLYEITDKDTDVLIQMFFTACEINKALIEAGNEQALHFGEEFANAIFAVLNSEFTYGECLALGMLGAAYVSWKMDYIKMEYFYEIRDMFVPFNLPISYEKANLHKIFESFNFINDNQSLVLLKAIGRNASVENITLDLVKESIEFLNFDLD